MQKNFKCQQCGHRFVAEDDLSTVCPECGSDLLQPINTRKVQPWMYAAAFIVFLAIGFGVSELIQPKLFAKAEDDVAIEQEPAGYENEDVFEEPYIAPEEATTDEPVMEEPAVTSPATDNPVAAPSKPSQPTVQPTSQPAVTPSAPSTPASEPRPATTTPSTPAAKPAAVTTVVSEPKPVVTTTPTPAPKPATTTTAPEPKPSTTTTATSQTPTSTPAATPIPAPATTKTGLTAADAQGIVASGKASSKIPDNTTITVNGQKMDYQAFRTGVNQKAYSNIKVTSVNPDGSIVVKATSHYED